MITNEVDIYINIKIIAFHTHRVRLACLRLLSAAPGLNPSPAVRQASSSHSTGCSSVDSRMAAQPPAACLLLGCCWLQLGCFWLQQLLPKAA